MDFNFDWNRAMLFRCSIVVKISHVFFCLMLRSIVVFVKSAPPAICTLSPYAVCTITFEKQELLTKDEARVYFLCVFVYA